MPQLLLITNAQTIFQSNQLQAAEILIQEGKIAGMGKPGELSVQDSVPTLDAHGHLVFPGLIDPHVHLRDSGVPNASEKQKEDFSTGTKAALAGGVTTVLDMPNTLPSTTSLSSYQTKRDHASQSAYCDFGLFAGASKDNVYQVPAMLEAGAVAVKMYVGSSTGNLLVREPNLEEAFFKSSAETGFVLAIHAEDQACLERHEAIYNDKIVPRHNDVRPPECAALAVKRALDFTAQYQNKTYVCHTSTSEEVRLIRDAKSDGLSVFMEVSPHHLFLSETLQESQGNLARINPPLRSNYDQKALWTALNDGTVDTIGTDHAPHTLEQKRKNYWDAPSGVPELDTLMPMLVTAALEEKTTLETIQRLCCHNPARIFGLKNKGSLEIGYDADFVFVDLKTERPVDESALFTRCGWSPYAGMRLRGWPVKTFLRGKLVFENGTYFGPFGKQVEKNG